MANITAPAAPGYPFYIGKGLQGTTGSIMIFGYPLPNYLSQNVPGIIGFPTGIMSPTTLFDVSTLPINSEVVAILYHNTSAHITSSVYYSVKWYRKRDNKNLFTFNTTISGPAEGSYYDEVAFYAWLGYCSSKSAAPEWTTEEIYENGDYEAVITATGGEFFTKRIDFCVKGIPTRLENTSLGSTTAAFDAYLGNYFDSGNYMRVGLTTQSITNGQSTPPTNILGETYAPGSNNSCVVEVIANGLIPNTSYAIYCFAQATNGLYYLVGAVPIVTKQAIAEPPSSPVVFDTTKGVDGRSQGAYGPIMYLKWGPSPTPQSVDKYWVKVYQNGAYKGMIESTTTEYTLQQLLSNILYAVTYEFRVSSYNTAGESAQLISFGTTAPKIPTLYHITTFGIDYFDMHVASDNLSDSNLVASIVVEVSLTSGGASIATKTTTPGQTIRFGAVDGIQGGNTYYVRAYSKVNLNGVDIKSNYSTIRTVTTNNRPTNWSWSKSFGANTQMVTYKDNGVWKAKVIPANEWYNFCMKIDQFRAYKGLLPYGFSNQVDGNTFTAPKFNEAIGAMISSNVSGKSPLSAYFTGGYTVPGYLSQNSKVVGDYFIKLKNALNSII